MRIIYGYKIAPRKTGRENLIFQRSKPQKCENLLLVKSKMVDGG